MSAGWPRRHAREEKSIQRRRPRVVIRIRFETGEFECRVVTHERRERRNLVREVGCRAFHERGPSVRENADAETGAAAAADGHGTACRTVKFGRRERSAFLALERPCAAQSDPDIRPFRMHEIGDFRTVFRWLDDVIGGDCPPQRRMRKKKTDCRFRHRRSFPKIRRSTHRRTRAKRSATQPDVLATRMIMRAILRQFHADVRFIQARRLRRRLRSVSNRNHPENIGSQEPQRGPHVSTRTSRFGVRSYHRFGVGRRCVVADGAQDRATVRP